MYEKMPKYVELYSELRQAILHGEYHAGSFLPTENELVEKYNVSKTTVRHAVKLLRDNKLVEVKQGSGTRILPFEQETVIGQKYNVPDAVTSILVQYSTSGAGEVHNTKAVIDKIPASAKVAEALNIKENEPVYRLQRLQLVDGLPFGYMVNYISQEMAPDFLSKGDLIINLYGHLNRHYGYNVTDISETINASIAGFMEAQYLQVDAGTPLIVLQRIAKDGDKVLEYCETVVRPDIFHMTVKVTSPVGTEIVPYG